MFTLVSSFHEFDPKVFEWMKYHYRRGFTHIFFISDATQEDEDELTKCVKMFRDDRFFNNVFIVHMLSSSTDINDTYNIIYNHFRDDIKWIIFLEQHEFLTLYKWNTVQQMTDDKSFKHAKQIVIPCLIPGGEDLNIVLEETTLGADDKQHNNNYVNFDEVKQQKQPNEQDKAIESDNVKNVRSFNKGKCKTRKVDTECRLGDNKTVLPNGVKQNVKTRGDVDNIEFHDGYVCVKHYEMKQQAFAEWLIKCDFSSKEQLLSFIPKDFPQELTDYVIEKSGFGFIKSDDDSEKTFIETKIVVDPQREELKEKIKQILNKVYPNKEYLIRDFDSVKFNVIAQLIKQHGLTPNAVLVHGLLVEIITDENRQQLREYKETHIYTEQIKSEMDRSVPDWTTRGVDDIKSFVKAAANVLNIVVNNIDKVFNLIMLFVKGKKPKDEQECEQQEDEEVDEQLAQPLETQSSVKHETKPKELTFKTNSIDKELVNDALQRLGLTPEDVLTQSRGNDDNKAIPPFVLAIFNSIQKRFDIIIPPKLIIDVIEQIIKDGEVKEETKQKINQVVEEQQDKLSEDTQQTQQDDKLSEPIEIIPLDKQDSQQQDDKPSEQQDDKPSEQQDDKPSEQQDDKPSEPLSNRLVRISLIN